MLKLAHIFLNLILYWFAVTSCIDAFLPSGVLLSGGADYIYWCPHAADPYLRLDI
jgi:hypothetical protein